MAAVPSEIEHKATAEAGLKRIETSELSIVRVPGRAGTFAYERESERPVGARDRKRIMDLVIPPAWSEVRIAADPQAHIQAIGRDEAGRLQYIYHADWEDVRTATKTYRLVQLGSVLGRLREAIAADLVTDGPKLGLAAAARLIDLLHLRAGHEIYAGDEGGRGAATLLKRHLELGDQGFRLRFRGKGGKPVDKSCSDAQLADALRELRSIRGPRLFKVRSAEGYRPITASDLNDYLAARAGKPVTAKDFRTLFASATALDLLCREGAASSPTHFKRIVSQIAKTISTELVNTPTITRKSYIHPL
ncbi:MAG: DNA topoisomerase IB, partial [Parvibaculaceae bacterium]